MLTRYQNKVVTCDSSALRNAIRKVCKKCEHLISGKGARCDDPDCIWCSKGTHKPKGLTRHLKFDRKDAPNGRKHK